MEICQTQSPRRNTNCK
ncbi:unnamed protein product, partial [Rotaria sordida]